MPTLLHIDASPRGDRSISRQLTREFAAAWKEANPEGQVIYRDLGRDPVPLVSCNLQEPWIRMILGFVGITDIDFVAAEGVVHLDRSNGEREQYLKPIREHVRFKAGSGLATAKS